MSHIPWRCRRRGHDWFPPIEQREFLPTYSVCLRARCEARHVTLPIGQCLNLAEPHTAPAHGLAAHYAADGSLVEVPGCAGPQ